MDNYKNTPQHLYGLSPSQMDMFMTEDNPVSRQAEKVTEVCLFLHAHFIMPLFSNQEFVSEKSVTDYSCFMIYELVFGC